MGLTARQKAYKREGRMYAKELRLAGYDVKMRPKNRKALMEVTAKNGSMVTVMNYGGVWYLIGGEVEEFNRWSLKAKSNSVAPVMLKLKEWLRRNSAY